MKKIIKEIAIMLGVILIGMLGLSIAFYRFIPSRKNVPEITTYVATDIVKDLLEDNIDTKSENKSPVLTYEVTSSELSLYQKANEYVPGKANPFAIYAPTVTEEEINGEKKEGVEVSTGKNSESIAQESDDKNTSKTTANEIKDNVQSSSTK